MYRADVSRIVIFGAGGRAGRRAVVEAASRGHQVTAVVRDPSAHPDLAVPGVQLVQGDVTDPDSVAQVAAGQDAAISTVYRPDVVADEFYVAGVHALLEGLTQARVPRLVIVGIGTLLHTRPGVRYMDEPEFLPEWMPFNLGRVAELDALQAADTVVDWVVVAAPPTPLDNAAPRSDRYRVGGLDLPADWATGTQFSYADLLAAVVDEIDAPEHHRRLVAVTY